MAKQQTEQKWYQRRAWAALIIPVALAACYVFASWAINSGSLIEYGVAFGLLVLALNRLAHIAIVSFTGKPHNG